MAAFLSSRISAKVLYLDEIPKLLLPFLGIMLFCCLVNLHLSQKLDAHRKRISSNNLCFSASIHHSILISRVVRSKKEKKNIPTA